MSGPSWTGPTPLPSRRWLAGLRLSFNDADGAALDMLLPPRQRELGPALHAQNYHMARKQIVQALAYASAPDDDDGEPGDGAPTH